MNNNYNGRNGGGNRPNGPQNQPRNRYRNPGQNRPAQNRQYNPPQSRQYSGTTPYPPVRHKSRKQERKAAALSVLLAVILVMLLVAVVIFISRCAGDAFSGVGKDTESDLDVTTPIEETLPDESTAETEPPIASDYEYIIRNEMDIHRGYQLLINYEHEFDFSCAMPMDTLYLNKNGAFKVSNTNDALEKTALANFVAMMQAFGTETGNSDIIVTSSDRSLEYQQAIWDSRVDTYGEEYARLYVAEPGHSEHHSGLALDLAIYTNKGEAYTFEQKPEYPEWLTKNAHRFGFIERYKADKTDITKIAYENWHYRYIGKPHAYYMLANNLCLEEYIEVLRAYTYRENELTFTDDEGVAWSIYFVPAVIGGETQIPVPIAGNYEVSGNNVDGFIVTVRK